MKAQLSVGERKFLNKQRKSRENPFSRHFETGKEAVERLREKYDVPDENGLTERDRKVIESLFKRESSPRNVPLEEQVNNNLSVFGSPFFRRSVGFVAGVIVGFSALLSAPHSDVVARSSASVLPVIQYAKGSDNSVLNISSNAVVKGGVSIDDLLGPVVSVKPDKSWYLKSNQPDSALITKTDHVPHTIERKVSVFIGKTYALVNGVETTLDAPPEIVVPPGRTYVPVRFIAENLGYKVKWDAKERKVTLSTADKLIELWIGKKYAVVDGVKIGLDSAPFIDPKYNRAYLPFRWLAEQLGATVSWDPNDPMGRKASFDLVKTTYTTVDHKEIDFNSDADGDGLIFKVEKEFGSNPNDKYTFSKHELVTDGEVYDWAKKFNVDPKNYSPKNGLSLEANVFLGFNPNTPFNITSSLTDRQALRLYKSLGHDSIAPADQIQNSIYDFVMKLVDDNFNEKYGTTNYEKTVVAGVLEAVELGYVKSDKDSIISMVKGINKELFDMLDNRAFKDNITIDTLVNHFDASDPDSPRILSLAALNSVFGENPINKVLAQSTQLQELVKTGKLSEAKDFVNLVYSAVNSEVPGMNVTEVESTPFKEAINQMVDFKLGKYNAADLMFSVYNKALNDEELMSVIKSHPKMFFAFTDYLGKFLSNEQALKEDEKAGKPVVMDEVVNLAIEHIKYQAWGEQQRQQMKSSDGSPIISTNLEKMSIGELMTLISLVHEDQEIGATLISEGDSYKDVLDKSFGWVDHAKEIFNNLENISGQPLEGGARNLMRRSPPEKYDFFTLEHSLASIHWATSQGPKTPGWEGKVWQGLPWGSMIQNVDYTKIKKWMVSKLEIAVNLVKFTTDELKKIAENLLFKPPSPHGFNQLKATIADTVGLPNLEVYTGSSNDYTHRADADIFGPVLLNKNLYVNSAAYSQFISFYPKSKYIPGLLKLIEAKGFAGMLEPAGKNGFLGAVINPMYQESYKVNSGLMEFRKSEEKKWENASMSKIIYGTSKTDMISKVPYEDP